MSVSSGLSWVAVTAGEDKHNVFIPAPLPPPQASGVSLSSTRFAAERAASLHPSLLPHRITLHCH